jgi:putative alpha-1,2-mannosidase
VALLLNKTDDITKYTNRSYNYRNVWDENQVSDNYAGFFQKRNIKCAFRSVHHANVLTRSFSGTFIKVSPKTCSPIDNVTQYCSLQQPNLSGFYESSSWEYSKKHLVHLCLARI